MTRIPRATHHRLHTPGAQAPGVWHAARGLVAAASVASAPSKRGWSAPLESLLWAGEEMVRFHERLHQAREHNGSAVGPIVQREPEAFEQVWSSRPVAPQTAHVPVLKLMRQAASG